MKLFNRWRKPAWEDRDAARRASAVANEQAPALLARLPELAQSDPDPQVRIAALRRVDDPSLLERRLRGEHDAAVAAVAAERLFQRLCQASLGEPERQALAHLHDVELLTRLACQAADAALRRAALTRLQKPGLLVERCLGDPDPALRLWLLERIDNVDALQRIAAAARRRDKALTRAARTKLDALQLAAGNPETLQRQALALGEQVARLARELPEQREAQLAALATQWQALAARVDDGLRRRVDGSFAMAEAALHGPPAVVGAAVAAAEQEEVTPEAASVISAEAAESAGGVIVEAVEQAVDPTPTALPVAAAAVVATAAPRLDSEALSALEQLIASGHTAGVRQRLAELRTLSASRAQQARLRQLEAELGKLEGWQRWSSQQARQALCAQVEALPAAGLHPDALAQRLRELQDEWKRLDGVDGSVSQALARRFHALAAQALEPARGYFEKRRELREQQVTAVEALLADCDARLDGLAAAELVTLRRQLGAALRELDRLAPGQRSRLGRGLRARLQRLEQRLDALQEQALLGKRRLLAQLRRELGSLHGAEAVERARLAQQEWKQLPRAQRSQEPLLWNELSELLDPLFAAQRASADQAEQRSRDRRNAAQALIDEVEALAAGDDERLLHAGAHLEALRASWRGLNEAAAEPDERDPRGGRRRPGARQSTSSPIAALEPAFERGCERLQAALAGAQGRRERQQLLAIADAAAQLAGGPPGQSAEAVLDSLPLAADARQALLQAWQATAMSDDEAATRAQTLVVQAELLAGVESPPDCQPLRRQLQMQRLAERLGGGAPSAPQQQLRQLWLQLHCLPTLAAEPRRTLAARCWSAWERLQGGSD